MALQVTVLVKVSDHTIVASWYSSQFVTVYIYVYSYLFNVLTVNSRRAASVLFMAVSSAPGTGLALSR